MNPIKDIAKIMRNNTVCIPKVIRTKMGIEPKDIVMFVYDGTFTTIKKISGWDSFAGAAKTSFRKIGGGEVFLRKERASWGKNHSNKVL